MAVAGNPLSRPNGGLVADAEDGGGPSEEHGPFEEAGKDTHELKLTEHIRG